MQYVTIVKAETFGWQATVLRWIVVKQCSETVIYSVLHLTDLQHTDIYRPVKTGILIPTQCLLQMLLNHEYSTVLSS